MMTCELSLGLPPPEWNSPPQSWEGGSYMLAIFPQIWQRPAGIFQSFPGMNNKIFWLTWGFERRHSALLDDHNNQLDDYNNLVDGSGWWLRQRTPLKFWQSTLTSPTSHHWLQVSVGDGVDVPRMMFISSFGLKYVLRSQYTPLLTEPTPADTTQVLVW